MTVEARRSDGRQGGTQGHTLMSAWIWLYERDFTDLSTLYEEAHIWYSEGYRVFIQGYSAMDCKEYKPR